MTEEMNEEDKWLSEKLVAKGITLELCISVAILGIMLRTLGYIIQSAIIDFGNVRWKATDTDRRSGKVYC